MTSVFYEWTRLDQKGDILVLKGVPFAGDGTRCDVCDLDPPGNPCIDFDSPIDVVDCEGNLCSMFDYCSTLDSVDWQVTDHRAITDLEWNMCPQARTNPHIYKQDLYSDL